MHRLVRFARSPRLPSPTVRRPRRGAALLTAVFAVTGALLFGSGPAQPADAATLIGSSGAVGRYVITDTVDHPGAGCIYDAFSTAIYPNGRILDTIRVRSPQIYARDRTSGVDSQVVTYVATVVRIAPNGTRSNVATGPVHQATATDSTPAALPFTTFDLTPFGSGTYAVVLNLAWRSPTNAAVVEGSAAFTLDLYSLALDRGAQGTPREDVRGGNCVTPYNRG
ncbi:MAG: hypothetical protein U0531_17020 [Dehalococcoidia bacterium]